MNSWTHPPEHPQTVERFEIPANLKGAEDKHVIDIVVVNNQLNEINLNGKEKEDFDSIQDDIYSYIHSIKRHEGKNKIEL